MRWFRRHRPHGDEPQARDGVVIDWEHYLAEIEGGTRPGLPDDGRYWMMMADAYPGELRLLWELAATDREARQMLKTMATVCRVAPRRLPGIHHDGVDGTWAAYQPRHTVGLLTIWHPASFGRPTKS